MITDRARFAFFSRMKSINMCQAATKPGRVLVVAAAAAALVSAACGRESSPGLHSSSYGLVNHPFTAEIPTDSDKPVYVRVARSVLNAAWIQRHGFIQDHVTGKTHVFGWVFSDTAQLKEQIGVEALDEKRLQTVAVDPDTMQIVGGTDVSGAEGIALKEGYHDYQELTAELEALTAAYPNLARLENAGKSASGRNLWYMKAGARLDAPSGGPRTLFIANMHGDESAGRELMVYLLRDLLAGYGKDERITRILNGSQVFIMPSMNPDGFEERQRWNANYKDLNRSFPDFTDDPDDRSAGRPAEVAAVMGLHDRYAFANSLNFHGGEVCFNMPWDTQPNRDDREKFGDDAYMNSLARAYASTNRTMFNNNTGTFDDGVTYGYEWYEVNGGMQDWSIVYRDTTHATIELSYAKFVSENSLATVWNENRESLLDFLDRSTLGVHLNVVDAGTGQTLTSKVEVQTSNAPRAVKFRDGIVHRLTPAGSHKVTIKAAGYSNVTLDADATRFSGNLRTVRLERLASSGR